MTIHGDDGVEVEKPLALEWHPSLLFSFPMLLSARLLKCAHVEPASSSRWTSTLVRRLAAAGGSSWRLGSDRRWRRS